MTALGAGAAFFTRRILRGRNRISFTNSVVVIIGGSRGLGLAIARELAAEGARLVLVARDSDELDEASRQVERDAGAVVTIPCDVGRREEVERAMSQAMEQLGRIDVLINAAGILHCGPLEHMSREDFEEAMDVNLWGAFHAMKAIIPTMRRQGNGRIVNIASVAGMVAVPHLAPYTTSKFALVGLSDAVRAELRDQDIRVTTVVPGLMRTGSHVNGLFKGQHEAEFAWFSIGNALPFISVSARRAARRVVDACRHGDAHLTIGVAARLAIVANALFPNLTASAMALADSLLPTAGTDQGDGARRGWELRSRWAPSILTQRSDKAVTRNNELRGQPLAQFMGERQ